MQEQVNHPQHYGGDANPYEAIKVIERYKLNFHLGNALKYILRAEKKGNKIQDLNKALWYLKRYAETKHFKRCEGKEILYDESENICLANNVPKSLHEIIFYIIHFEKQQYKKIVLFICIELLIAYLNYYAGFAKKSL